MITIFALSLLVTIWYRRRLKKIHADLLSLYAIDASKVEYKIFSEEVDAISLRMKRKTVRYI